MSDFAAEFWAMVILGIIGFIIGGIYGHYWDGGFSPDCWYGLLIGIGAPICVSCGHNFCD
jgi:hypothetical protein